jgi:hypothetical protein
MSFRKQKTKKKRKSMNQMIYIDNDIKEVGNSKDIRTLLGSMVYYNQSRKIRISFSENDVRRRKYTRLK